MKKTLSRLTKKEFVEKAIEEYDEIGRESFLRKYGYGKAKSYYLVYRGKHYDSKAIVGAAYHYQCGKPLASNEFTGGKGSVFPKLKGLGFKVVTTAINDDTFALPEEVRGNFPEGATRQVLINAYERNHQARIACIEHHGSCCTICGFDFGKRYGENFEGLIHVHHIVPLSKLGKESIVDPKKDLIPVCPNCHAVIHYGGKTQSVQHVKEILNS
mgnify:FL=1